MATTPQSELNHGALTTPKVVFFVLAAVAPIGAVASAMVLGMLLGNGAAMPGTYVLLGLMLLCFATGYATMSKHVTNAGAFYAFITRGLGRPAGLGGAFVAVVAYNALFWSIMGAFGYFANATFKAHAGIDWPWWVWSLTALALVALLGRRQVDLNAIVLGSLLVIEVAILLYLDVKIIQHRGFSAFSFNSFNPHEVFHGAIGISMMFALNCFIGFEATAIFGEEAKDPERTVPRATYISIGIISVFYALTCWTLVSAYGANQLGPALLGPDPKNPNPGLFLFTTDQIFAGSTSEKVLEWLVVSSVFAAALATHNAASRYFFALGRERVLPTVLARTHPKLKSPYVASAVQVVIAAVVVVAFALARKDPLLVFATSTGGVGTLGVAILMAGVAAAVVGFFWKRPDRNLLTTVLLPAIGGCGLVFIAFEIVNNYSLLAGTPSAILNHAYWLVPIVAVAGIGYGLWLRTGRPDVYAGIGGIPVWETGNPEPPEVDTPAVHAR